MNKPSVSEVQIKRIVKFLASKPRNSADNPHRHTAVSTWISSKFDQIGLDVSHQVFNIPRQKPERKGTNVIGTLHNPRDVSKTSNIIIGAHYDTVSGSPGADDNASGIAALLECARILKKSNTTKEITFVAFDAEEVQPNAGGLHGSVHFVSSLSIENMPSSVIIFESIGFSSQAVKQQFPKAFRFMFPGTYKSLKNQGFGANSLLILSRGKGREISDHLEHTATHPEILLPVLPLKIPGWMPAVKHTKRSDHAPFWVANIPAVMISDTANFRNPHYHQATDTPETIDLLLIKKAAQMVIRTIEANLI
tara:strand:+ start:3025 stop:3948 length:924 start_codon:yes stop_codon:yes gene_type:complete